MQRIEQVVGFAGDHSTWHSKNRCTLLSDPLRSNGLPLFAERKVPPARGKILDPDAVYRYRGRNARLDHHVARPRRFVLEQHFEHGEGLAFGRVYQADTFAVPSSPVEPRTLP